MDAGTVLGDRYRLVSQLGKGGMATVWRATHVTLGSPAAIKLMHVGMQEDPDARARFIREARAAATLRCPHVVQIFDYGVDGELPYIAMELLEGETLAQRLRRDKSLRHADAIWILEHVARALDRAHEAGVVHRDLKPANIFLVQGESPLAKVLDFGIAKFVSSTLAVGTNPRTQAGTLLGTPRYMSPEQVECNSNVDHTADIWALGVITFECLTGRSPFEGLTLPTVVRAICDRPIPLPSHIARVPQGFDAWFARAAARNPRERFQSAKAAVAALTAILDQAGEHSSPEAPVAPEIGETLPERMLEPAAPTSLTLKTSKGFRLTPWTRRVLWGIALSGGLVAAGFVIAGQTRGRERRGLMTSDSVARARSDPSSLQMISKFKHESPPISSAVVNIRRTDDPPGHASATAPNAQPVRTKMRHSRALVSSRPRPESIVPLSSATRVEGKDTIDDEIGL